LVKILPALHWKVWRLKATVPTRFQKSSRLLGFETRIEVHAFLKEHGVYLNYTVEDLQRDIRISESPGDR
jgi:hypothetical protein